MTSERIWPSEKTISWNSHPSLGNEAASQGSAIHLKWLHISLSPWREKAVAYLTESPHPLAQGLTPNWNKYLFPEAIYEWMTSLRLGTSWFQRWENVVFLALPTLTCLFQELGLCVLWRPKTVVLMEVPATGTASWEFMVETAFSIPTLAPALGNLVIIFN